MVPLLWRWRRTSAEEREFISSRSILAKQRAGKRQGKAGQGRAAQTQDMAPGEQAPGIGRYIRRYSRSRRRASVCAGYLERATGRGLWLVWTGLSWMGLSILCPHLLFETLASSLRIGGLFCLVIFFLDLLHHLLLFRRPRCFSPPPSALCLSDRHPLPSLRPGTSTSSALLYQGAIPSTFQRLNAIKLPEALQKKRQNRSIS